MKSSISPSRLSKPKPRKGTETSSDNQIENVPYNPPNPVLSAAVDAIEQATAMANAQTEKEEFHWMEETLEEFK